MLLLPRIEHRMRGWISFTKPQSPGRIHETAPCEAKGVGKSETCLPGMSAVCYFTTYLAYSNVSLCRDNKKCDDARPCTRCKARSEACIHIERGPKNVKARCKRCREEDHKVSHIFCHSSHQALTFHLTNQPKKNDNSAKTAGHASSAKMQVCTAQTFPEKGGRTANGSRQPASTAGETKSNVIQSVHAADVSGAGCSASTGRAGVLRRAWGTPVPCVVQGKLRTKSSERMKQPI